MLTTRSNRLSKTQLKQCVQDALADDPRYIAAFLLGSAGRGAMRPDSDIDIAILLTPGDTLDAFERVALAVGLGRVLQREIDIGVLNDDNLVYAKEAFLNGECIYCRDVSQRDLFRTRALGLYLELRDNRREVEYAYRT